MNPILHHYHCPLCGNRLFEAGMGALLCKPCNQLFIPTYREEDNEYSLSWIPRPVASAQPKETKTN